MKKTLAMLMGGVSILLACKKNTNSAPSFEKITYQTIKGLEAQFTQQGITVYYVEKNELALKPGTVILYKTSNGNLGKLKIKSVEDGAGEAVFHFDYLNFDATGKPMGQTASSEVVQNDFFELDLGKVEDSDASDWLWFASSGGPNAPLHYSIIAQNNATFMVYAQ